MEKKDFFEEIALACTAEVSKIRQTMYLIMNSDKTIEQTKEAIVDSVVANFMKKIDDPKLVQMFNSRIGFTDRELYKKAEKTLIYEIIESSLSFPKRENGFMLSPVGHYFKEENILEIFDSFDSFARAINDVNKNSFEHKVLVTFKGPNIYGGETLELYFAGGKCPIALTKKNKSI